MKESVHDVQSIPTEFCHTYDSSTPLQTAVSRSTVIQISSNVSFPGQGSDQSESDFEIEGHVDEDNDDKKDCDCDGQSNSFPAIVTREKVYQF